MYQVVWTRKAKVSFNKEIDFIYKKWDEKIVERFLNRTDEIIRSISHSPLIFKAYKSDKTIRHGLLHENVTMFYRIVPERSTIEILLFWNNLRNPQKLLL